MSAKIRRSTYLDCIQLISAELLDALISFSIRVFSRAGRELADGTGLGVYNPKLGAFLRCGVFGIDSDLDARHQGLSRGDRSMNAMPGTGKPVNHARHRKTIGNFARHRLSAAEFLPASLTRAIVVSELEPIAPRKEEGPMVKVNSNYLELPGSYLFSEIGRRVNAYKAEHPDAPIIRMGIGDVTRPLAPAIIKAMHDAVEEMAHESSFRGYGPDQGYGFLIDKIISNDFQPRGIELEADEIFISDGAKCDTGNIQELFSLDSVVAVTDPVYPVYADTNIMAGRAGKLGQNGLFEKLVYLPCIEANGLKPKLPDRKVDLIYLCFPNNPTGMTLTRQELKPWVDYARKNGAIILFDAAYEAFISEPEVPHSIYEIEGARDVAIEFRSFSKTAGFTGTRCAFTVIPKTVMASDLAGKPVSLNKLWLRRQTTKFNGVSYPVQVAAAAVYSPEGKKQASEIISYYMANARIIREGLNGLGYKVYGGINAPYIWLKTPGDMKSWDFFDKLLREIQIVGTPGSGFGPSGEGYFRLTAFGSRENTEKAMDRMKKLNIG